MRAMRMCPWRRSQRREDELPMYQEHYDALFSMDFVETKYPHDDTMKALGIFEDVELVLKNMRLAKFFSTAWSHTRSSLVSFGINEVPQVWSSIELSWTKVGDGSRSWQGRKEGDTFRQLEILLVSLMEREPIGISRRMSSKELGYNR
ncbi:unnamed protein product [Microthlaspi erraticum]|uniref:Arabidopsis retrotransposon Orf1 C-terminal domain-containing protein n=1 Tax=Microthlaspi erraticum TaxID=1685480 RepID=A0A6D2KAB0_9BRAS|nr:unnamed protein product [Microthlaspi erraticum]